MTSSVTRGAELWALLHNGCPPEGRWSPESRRYYERVAALFDEIDELDLLLAPVELYDQSRFRDEPCTLPLIIEVLSRPTTQGSKRPFINYHTGKAMMSEQTGARLKNWREDVRAAAAPYRGRFVPKEPLRVVAHFTLAKPVSAPKKKRTWPTSKRIDIDKLLRSTYDALASSGVYDDDSQIVQQISSKSYPGEGDGPASPGVRLLIYSLTATSGE